MRWGGLNVDRKIVCPLLFRHDQIQPDVIHGLRANSGCLVRALTDSENKRAKREHEGGHKRKMMRKSKRHSVHLILDSAVKHQAYLLLLPELERGSTRGKILRDCLSLTER